MTDTFSPAPARLRWCAIVAGIVGFVLFLATPLLPVKQVQSSVQWPQQDSLASINAPLISLAPESIEAEFPLAATEYLREGQDLLYGTVPPGSKKATTRGLFVRTGDGGLTVASLDDVLLDLSPQQVAALPADAALKLSVTADATRVQVGSHTATSDEDLRPQVTGVYTELEDTPAARAALSSAHVDVEINSRFTSSPTPLKLAAMIIGLLMVALSLLCLWRLDRLDGRRMGFMPATWKQVRPLDGVVAAVLVFWHIFGANTSDDGFILTMARVSDHAEYMANYYRWYGVPESPFGSPYYDLLAVMTQISTASVFMRLPSLLAGLVVWFVLSREILPRFGELINSRRVAHWTAALMFLSFWLPYNNGIRPEPMVAMGVMLTWASFERAIATRRLLPAAVGTIIATITLAVGPTGLFAVGVFLVSLPQVFDIMGQRARSAGWMPFIAPFLACGTAIMVLVFGDQTLAAVLESTSVRTQVGPSLPWYSEFARYTTLFQESVDGSLTRRFAMFTMLFSLGLVLYAFIKDRRVAGAEPGPTTRLLLIVALSMFFLMFTPTKWTHHFGIYAGVAGVLAAQGSVVLSQIALRSSRARTFALAAVTFLMAISLAGWNAWWYVSSFGIPWWDRTVQFKGVEAATVVLGIALVIAAVGVVQSLRQRRRRRFSESEAQFRADESQRVSRWAGVMSAPIAVACALMVAFSMASFAKGYVSQGPAYSVGRGNLASLAGQRCGLAEHTLVETNTNESFLEPVRGTLADSLEDPEGSGFGPSNIPDDIEPENQNSASVGAIANSGSEESAINAATTPTGQNEDSAEAAAEGKGERAATGVNGSHTHLPFNLDYRRVPVMGSYSENQQGTAQLTSQWFHLPEAAADSPLLVVSAAGRIYHHDVNGVEQEGEDLVLEYGTLRGGRVGGIGKAELSDVGATPEWRNLRLPLADLPEEANVVRLVAKDASLDERDWMAFVPPRVPTLATLNSLFDGETPGLLDWSVALQFPCQRTFDHYAGVTEIPQYRILPDSAAQTSLTDFQSFSGGGALSTAEAVNYAYELPSYLNHDWARDWGAIEKYELRTNSAGEAPRLAVVEQEEITRTGWWKNSDMKIRKDL
ncbi:arabinosyltransferase domain-containing protein [Corynebacterium lizhenjunii]|uniref:Arabinosyltransferase domain-containing protein n=1 Tax=Corynebacterium lizhenjunii TaxID=2709394 RepID=A0A7T0KFQ9_9CORY|nr:arabinosyltransferase domain-containing protein [Corynebacterium lizhenjunii]QPK79254.1 arabinosyltransferase domain-containing protein [Corynebacterium lizhenjunii]